MILKTFSKRHVNIFHLSEWVGVYWFQHYSRHKSNTISYKITNKSWDTLKKTKRMIL
jgi:hypothetical protein